MRGMHTSIELLPLAYAQRSSRRPTHHDRLALVLYYMTRPSDLIAATQAQKHKFVGGINGVLVLGRQRGEFALCRHGCQGWIDSATTEFTTIICGMRGGRRVERNAVGAQSVCGH